jgi:hypothetical protein
MWFSAAGCREDDPPTACFAPPSHLRRMAVTSVLLSRIEANASRAYVTFTRESQAPSGHDPLPAPCQRCRPGASLFLFVTSHSH